MQENEFEKKLQQKIDKLQLQPAEEVWQKIQDQVAVKKRKRRGVIFFFVLSGLIIAGLFLTDTTGVFTRKGSIAANEIKTTEQGKDQLIPSSSNNRTMAGKPLDDRELAATAATINNAGAGSTDRSTPPVLYDNNKIIKTKLKRAGTKGSAKMNIVSAQPDNIIDNTNDISTATSPADKTNSVTITGNTNDNATDLTANKMDSLAAIKKAEPVIETVKNDVPVVKKTSDKDKTKSHKWGVSVVAAGGIAATGSNYLKNGDYASDGLGSTPNTGSNAGNGTYMPSKTSPGISFLAGIQLYRNISATSRLITGLQYQMLNTSIETGQPVTSGIFAYAGFASGTQKKYNNHYHFISVPLNFSTRLFHIGQRDICFDAGLTYSRLISTNALNFNASQGVYYKDESVFNKSQWGLNTAIKFNLSGKNRSAFYIGPEFYYSLTPLASSGIYSGAHNSFIGLRLQKDLKK